MDRLKGIASDTKDAFETLIDSFVGRVEELHDLAALRKSAGMCSYDGLADRIGSLEVAYHHFKEDLDAEEASLGDMEAELNAIRNQNARLHAITDALPASLPGDRSKGDEEERSSKRARLPLKEKSDHSNGSTVEAAAARGSSPTASSRASTPSAPPARKAPRAKKVVPSINLVTVSELQNVPKYIRGRLTIESVNALVREFNNIVVAKYDLLSKKVSKLRAFELKMYNEYCEQVNKETKGTHFFTDKDVRVAESLKKDSRVKPALQTLRHTHRLKMIVGGGVTRYVVVV